MPIHARDDLTDWEQKVVDAAEQGAELVCSDPSVGDHAVDSDSLPGIRAEVIRDLLLGRYGELDPHGVRIRGAQIIGALDLNHVRAAAGLELINCVVPEAITAEWARLPRLVLRGCLLTTMHADGLRVEGELVLDHIRATGSGERGTIRLMDARIGGDFDCDDATIINDSGPALTADRIDIGGGLVGRRCRVSGVGEKGALRLPDAHVGGQVSCNDAEIVNNSGPALIAERIRTDGSVWLERLHTKGVGENGTLRLLGAHIGGQFCVGDAELLNNSGPAVVADGLQVGKDLFLLRSRVDAASKEGAIRLPGAHVGGQLACHRTEITNDSGPALVADGLHVDKGLFLRQLRARGKGERGVIRLVSAQVGDSMTCDSSQICNEHGPALYADRIQVTGTLAVRLVHAKGTGPLGTIRLLNAHIDGQFDCDGTNVENASGYTFALQGASVGADVLLPTTVICPDPGLCNPHTQPRLVDLDGFTFRTLGRGTWTQWLHLIRHHTPDYRPQPYQQLAATERSAGHDGNARLILINQQHDLRTRAPGNLGNWFLRRAHWLWGVLTGYGYRARRTALALLLALATAGTVGYIAGHVDTRPGHHAAERAAQPATDPAAAGTPCSTVELLGLGLDRGLPLGPGGLRGRCEVDTTSTVGQGFAALIWIIQAIVWALAVLALAGYTNLIRKPA